MILLIVNPVAGKLKARSTLLEIVEVFSAAGLDVNVRLTMRRGHARELARQARRETYEKIVCVGGDGTLNEVISGVIESGEEIPLGYIPLGSTNDFAATLQLSHDVATAARSAMEGEAVKLDIGDFSGQRNFAYIASFGMFTAASYNAPQATKNVLGHFAYILEGIKDIVNIKSYHMQVEAGSAGYDGDYIFGAVANSTSIGGIVKLDKAIVDLSDGLFEIVLIKQIRTPNDLNLVLSSIMYSDFDNKMFEFIHASDVRFKTEEDINWSLDGEEAAGGRDLTIRNIHGAITLYK